MKLSRLAALAAAATIAVAACSSGGAAAPSDPLGVVTIPADEPLHIAFWGVLSGADASLGQDALTGVQIAVDDKGGKLLGRDIRLTQEDGGCTPEGGATAAQKLAADKTIVALVGSSCSDETVGGIKTLTEAGLTTISPSNTRPALTFPDRDATYAGYLRTAHSDSFQGKAVAEFVFNQLKLTKAATVHDGSAYAEALQQVFADEFKKLGGTITVQEAVSKGQTDMKPVLTKIAATSPEVLYLPIFVAEGGFITAQAKEVPGLENTVLIGSDGVFTRRLRQGRRPRRREHVPLQPELLGLPVRLCAFTDKYKAKVGNRPDLRVPRPRL